MMLFSLTVSKEWQARNPSIPVVCNPNKVSLSIPENTILHLDFSESNLKKNFKLGIVINEDIFHPRMLLWFKGKFGNKNG